VRKKITILAKPLFLLLAALPLLVVLVMFCQQQMARHEMKESLEKKHLETIVLAEKDVHWIHNSKEIIINGHYFDVKSYHYENGTYTFTGLYDKKETAIANEVSKQQEQGNNTGSKLLTYFFQLFQSDNSNNYNFCFYPTLMKEDYHFYNASFISQYPSIAPAPPKC
jgi:hypothetical protein